MTPTKLMRERNAQINHFKMTIIPVCADSVARLRDSDVYRAVHLAFDEGLHVQFGLWLKAERPELTELVDEALRFCAEDIADARAQTEPRRKTAVG